MRFAIASNFGCALSWWKRLEDEGNDVRVWINPGKAKDAKPLRFVGEGIVKKVGSWSELLTWAKEQPTIMLFDSSGMGELADEARKAGIAVVGGGKFADRLEEERLFGFSVADQAGCTLPPYKSFATFDSACAHAKKLGEKATYFKTDRYLDSDATYGAETGEEMALYLKGLIREYGTRGACILQDKVDGVALSTGRWWNGRRFVGPYFGTIEHKKLMNDDVGPSTGCSFNLEWAYEDTPDVAVDLGFERYAQVFNKYQAPPGIYDVNAVVFDNKAYFLEWTPRLGYDANMTDHPLIDDLGKFLYGIAMGDSIGHVETDYGVLGLRVTAPPYPWEHIRNAKKYDQAVGDLIQGMKEDDISGSKSFAAYLVRLGEDGYEIAAPEGIVGVAIAHGPGGLEGLAEECYDTAKRLKVPGGQWRTDAAQSLEKDIEEIGAAGYLIPVEV